MLLFILAGVVLSNVSCTVIDGIVQTKNCSIAAHSRALSTAAPAQNTLMTDELIHCSQHNYAGAAYLYQPEALPHSAPTLVLNMSYASLYPAPSSPLVHSTKYLPLSIVSSLALWNVYVPSSDMALGWGDWSWAERLVTVSLTRATPLSLTDWNMPTMLEWPDITGAPNNSTDHSGTEVSNSNYCVKERSETWESTWSEELGCGSCTC